MNGRYEVPVAALPGVTWRKSRHSGKWGNCVELAALDDGTIALRQSRERNGTALICTRAELAAFLSGAKDGEFDDLVS
ncbi:DUF397 domain-containing protein [Saccharopolyspora sp. NPDC000359]|uniref:DUF397 domain-containing protein n=1 Tax=Saccharopolyspora sp. NPDC000359 TaxID=3154251 RepID=UPI00331E6E66